MYILVHVGKVANKYYTKDNRKGSEFQADPRSFIAMSCRAYTTTSPI